MEITKTNVVISITMSQISTKFLIGAFLWKSTRQILVMSITLSQTCPGGCYIHNNITNSNKTKSCYIHNNVTNSSSSIIWKYWQLTSGASLLTPPCIPKILTTWCSIIQKYWQLTNGAFLWTLHVFQKDWQIDSALFENIDNLQQCHWYPMYSKQKTSPRKTYDLTFLVSNHLPLQSIELLNPFLCM